MGSQTPYDQKVEDQNDPSNSDLAEQNDISIKAGYDAKRRRQIEDYMDDRLLASELKDTYDDIPW